MKIEKINENRIKCTLSKSDLDARQLSIKELASGSGKAQKLISEMIETAGKEFDFHINNEPVIIEAAQLPDGEVHFYISKGGTAPILNHDAKDKTTFTITTSKETLESNIPAPTPTYAEAKEAIDHFFDFAKQQVLGKFAELPEVESGPMPAPSPIPMKKPASAPVLPEVLTRTFMYTSRYYAFKSLEALKKVYLGNVSVYENPNTSSYYVVIYGVPADADTFNRTCNLLTEYGAQLKLQCSNESYYREHYDLIYQGGIQDFNIEK